ncbi:MAG: response regulator [Polyangiaceae bacterium]|nr:response regulator [Polyangiaceae bacterium]
MNSRTPSIVLVDDDVRLLESLEDLFESAGYAVRTFSSARSLLDAGLAGIDCLIADIGMPGMDGFQLHEAVKKQRPELPVILITGRHEIADQQRASAKNITGFFRKPFDGPTLLTAVSNALGDGSGTDGKNG